MLERTQAEPSPTTPGRWCHWHKGPSQTAVAVQSVESASGPGYTLYACAPCREQRRLTPLAEQAAGEVHPR